MEKSDGTKIASDWKEYDNVVQFQPPDLGRDSNLIFENFSFRNIV